MDLNNLKAVLYSEVKTDSTQDSNPVPLCRRLALYPLRYSLMLLAAAFSEVAIKTKTALLSNRVRMYILTPFMDPRGA